MKFLIPKTAVRALAFTAILLTLLYLLTPALFSQATETPVNNTTVESKDSKDAPAATEKPAEAAPKKSPGLVDLFLVGAVGYAMAAVRIQETMLGILRVASVPGFDQYLPIFEARISAILTSHSRLSPIISRPAKGAWGRVRNSENPEKAVFASREMTPEQRVTARRKHQVALLAATAARALPLDVRRKVAVEICSR